MVKAKTSPAPNIELVAPGWFLDGLRVHHSHLAPSIRIPTPSNATPSLEVTAQAEVLALVPITYLYFNRTTRRTEDGLTVYELEKR